MPEKPLRQRANELRGECVAPRCVDIAIAGEPFDKMIAIQRTVQFATIG